MNLLRWFWACFCSVQSGALAICVGLLVLEQGPVGVFEGVAVWSVGQIAIFPISILALPLGAFLRMVLGFLFVRAKLTALATGTTIGVLSSGALAITTSVTAWDDWVTFLLFGALAGMVGGWTWWQIERPSLEEIQND
ncbi:hypothetical protein [uncultured Tateyamaria sp.]|uniref:hypothetical protein n=1 Tax=uncultured Tateyamaria sp. TaxID=455651 RepID=UPI002619E618|nr:hypothetical protein [uncultured Tateyamaria sp.]